MPLAAPRRIPLVLFAAAVALLVLMLPTQLHATSYTFDLTLTDTANSAYSGTGVVSLNVAGALVAYMPYYVSPTNGITALSFVVNGQSYNLNDASVSKSSVLIEFSQITPSYAVWDLTFADTVGTSPNRLELASTGGYVVYYNNLLSQTTGTFSGATLVPSAATPEPGSFVLLATGLAGAAGTVGRRVRRGWSVRGMQAAE